MPDGTQKIEDTGPLTKKRMETVDDETSDRALAFIEEQTKAGKPWFVWWNGTRMHFRTHVKDELRGISGQDEYADGMVEHDRHIGKFLQKLDALGIADNTIVFYSTDNGPALQHLAGCGRDALPRREEHQLGGRLARTRHGALARASIPACLEQSDRPSHGLAADLPRDRRRAGHQRQAVDRL
jgi:arylsulfatase A-like enzyme